MMMSLISYWAYTGDSTYNTQVQEAIQHQSGDLGDFMTRNQTRTTGNDDQGFWGFAAMEAAEQKFPDPSDPKAFSYLSLAQGVFNTQVPRWDLPPSTCGGGLKWQVFPFNAGYNYKNTISNGCFFSLAARLARYTGNTTYSDWAEKAYDWTRSIGLIDQDMHVYDGADDVINCTALNPQQFSYVAGVFLHGSAYMWNMTQEQKWHDRVDGFLKGIQRTFFPDGKNIMVEITCEPFGTCNNDMQSFKTYLSRWMATTSQLAPWTAATIQPMLKTSAVAAAQQCSGPGNVCGFKWTNGAQYDGLTGPGEQMAAMEVIGGMMVFQGHGEVPPPVTQTTGGTSKGDPNAGGSKLDDELGVLPPITTGDRAGAGIITFLVMAMLVGGCAWMLI